MMRWWIDEAEKVDLEREVWDEEEEMSEFADGVGGSRCGYIMLLPRHCWYLLFSCGFLFIKIRFF